MARWVFWPRIPVYGAEDEKLSGLWARMSGFIARRARMSWVPRRSLCWSAAFFLTTLKADGLSIADSFGSTPRSVTGQRMLQQHFPGGSGNPAVIVGERRPDGGGHRSRAEGPGRDRRRAVHRVAATGRPAEGGGRAGPADATLADPADSDAAQATVAALREAVHAVPGADAKVGGFTAINFDTQQSSQRDRRVIIPIVLVVILLDADAAAARARRRRCC